MGQTRSSQRVFKTAWFSRAARKALIFDDELCAAIRQAMLGQADDLGGGVFKKRLSKNRYRSIIVAKGGRNWVFAYLFAKNKIEPTSNRMNWSTSGPWRTFTPANRTQTLQGNLIFVNLWRFAMPSKRKYKSDAYEAIHSAVDGMYRAGTIDKATMREFDEACLSVPPPMDAKRIKRIRESQKVSQPVFARYLNTSESTVEKWESGAKKPGGMALKLLDLVEKHGLRILV